jgi:hypothetical protein
MQRMHRDGDVIVQQGDTTCDDFHVIVQGEVVAAVRQVAGAAAAAAANDKSVHNGGREVCVCGGGSLLGKVCVIWEGGGWVLERVKLKQQGEYK